MTRLPTFTKLEEVVEWLESHAVGKERSEPRFTLASDLTVNGEPISLEMAFGVICAHLWRLGLSIIQVPSRSEKRLFRVETHPSRSRSHALLRLPEGGTTEEFLNWKEHWSGTCHLHFAYRFACDKHAAEAVEPQILSSYRDHAEAGDYRNAILTLRDLGQTVKARGGYWRDLEKAAERFGERDLIPSLRRQFKAALRRLAATASER